MRTWPGKLFGLIGRRPFAAALVGLALLAVSGAGTWYGWRTFTYWRHRQAADHALEHYDLDTAHDELAVCLDLAPRDAELRLLAAQTARRAGLLDEAERQLDAYQGVTGQATPEGALERALLTAQEGQLSEVEPNLESLLEVHHPSSPRILEAMAKGAIEVYRVNDAGNWLDALLQKEPGDVQALLARATLYESVNKIDAALADYQKAVQCEPDHYKARLQLAQALWRNRRPDEATPYFERLRQDRPHDAAVLLGLARCRKAAGRIDDQRRLLDELLRDHPDDQEALLDRGAQALDDGDLGAAEGWLRRAVELSPFNRQANYQLGKCLNALGRPEEAEFYVRRIASIEADMKRLEGLYPKTLAAPSDPAPRCEADMICMRNGQEQEALRWLFGALQSDPRYQPAHDALADYYERHGDPKAAAEHRRREPLTGPLLPRPADGARFPSPGARPPQ
jgi:tetratricopeptide (TPR) repeat protein